jgi:hypothetical protein
MEKPNIFRDYLVGIFQHMVITSCHAGRSFPDARTGQFGLPA